MTQSNTLLTEIENDFGAIPDKYIKQFMNEGLIIDASLDNVNPSSLDLRIDLDQLVSIPCAFTPSKKRSTIADTLKQLNAQRVLHGRDNYYNRYGWSIEPHKVYVAPIVEKIRLPPHFFGRGNPKSTTGRTDVHTQFMRDFIPQYDRIPEGSIGNSYALFRANSFPILFPEECHQTPVNQLRIFKNDLGMLTTKELQTLARTTGFLRNDHKQRTLMFGDMIQNNQVELSVDLREWGDDDCLGFVAKRDVKKPLIWESRANDRDDFFEPIPKVMDHRTFRLEKGRFYILSSRESIHIPRQYACEMVPFDDTRGEVRAHYAGFIDNGWGEKGPRPLTLEVRAFEPTLIYHGQPIASVILHKMHGAVEKGYDDKETSNYTHQQTAKLGKFFK